MVRPVLQEKFVRDIKKYCSHISSLGVRSLIPLALTESAHPPHQVFGFE